MIAWEDLCRAEAVEWLEEPERVASLLANCCIELLGRIPWASNGTLLTRARAHGESCLAVFKPEALERPLWDFPPGLWRREVAAYELARLSGLCRVPPTVVAVHPELGRGSLQLFVPHDPDVTYFELVQSEEGKGDLLGICLFDIVANNADRKGGHVIAGPDGGIWAIDHGLCFHEDRKLRTVIWDFAGQAVPADKLAVLESLAGAGLSCLAGYVTEREVEATRTRAEAILRQGVFPAPPSHARPYPWPLV